ISGLSGVGGPPGFMMIHELDSFTMHGFSSRTTVPPRTRELKSRDLATLRTVMNNVTRMPSLGKGRLPKSIPGTGSAMNAPWLTGRRLATPALSYVDVRAHVSTAGNVTR